MIKVKLSVVEHSIHCDNGKFLMMYIFTNYELSVIATVSYIPCKLFIMSD